MSLIEQLSAARFSNPDAIAEAPARRIPAATLARPDVLSHTSAQTWRKVPCVEGMERVMQATTLPCLLLGGEVSEDLAATVLHWGAALQMPNVKGLVIGRALLFLRGGDVAAAVDQFVEVL